MMSAGNPDDGKNPRIPKDLKGLLKYCVEAAVETNDEGSPSAVQPMSEERKEWLAKALDDMTVNPVDRMKVCISILEKADESDDMIDRKIQAFEELIEWCENLDFAIDFHKIGGFRILPGLLEDEEAELRWMTLELIASLVQNNPYCQKAIEEGHYVPVLLKILDTDSNSTVQVKAMYAVSCLLRENAEAQKLFTDNDGFSVLMRAMQRDTEKLKLKAAFLLQSICSNQPAFKDVLCDMGMIEQLITLINQEHSPFHEHLIGALLSVVRDHSKSIEECQRPEFRLQNILQDRIEYLDGKEEYLEEKAYAEELLSLISDTSSAASEAVR